MRDELAPWTGLLAVRGYVTFGGKVGEEATGYLERWKPRGEWRNFDRVTVWARAIDTDLSRA